MNTKIKLLLFSLLAISLTLHAQVKIGNNPNTINSNSLLELESTSKGFLPPRVALTDVNSASPLTGTVPSGMLVYSSGGTLSDGYYYWNGTKWLGILPSSTGTIGSQAYGCFSSSTNQLVSSTSTAKLVTYDTDEIVNLVTH